MVCQYPRVEPYDLCAFHGLGREFAVCTCKPDFETPAERNEFIKSLVDGLEQLAK